MNIKYSLSIIVFIVALLIVSGSYAAAPKTVRGERVVQTSLPPVCETIGEIAAVKCKKNPIISRLGCDDIKPPPFYWGGLKPYLPIAICLKYRGASSSEYVRQTGCKMQVREQYALLQKKKKGHKMLLIKDKQSFKSFFAPIESGPEALSYITALTSSYPVYEFSEQYFIRSMDEDGAYTGGKLKPTEVWEKKDGWHVRLFDHVRCGCHRPELFEIEYVVTKDGYITQKKKKTVWQANRLYNICID
jgi:hypothetical protein